jgi:hypothetical protein
MRTLVVASALSALLQAMPARAAGHGPLFGATTPTLGRGGWSVDQAWTARCGEDGDRQQMLRTMVSFGITENLQVSGSVPLAMSGGRLAEARMMSLMSSEREFEGLVGYRFQRRTIGIGGRQESTVYVGGTTPLETRRVGVGAGRSIEVGGATGYASRAHYVWVGGGVQHFLERAGDRLGGSRLATIVYGYRPPALRTEAGKPDLRFFVEATAEDRASDQVGGVALDDGARTVFVGPTALLLHKAIGVEGGILFPAYQRIGGSREPERFRIAINFAFFFWLK